MDSDQGKLFIGGISWETSEEKLNEYFGKYGEVVQTVIMRDKITGRPRGFGFVVFSDPSILDIVLQDKHIIDGRTVEAKRALSRDEQNTAGRSGNPNAGRNSGSGGNIKTKKIFVGGLPATLTEEGFRQYFEAFGDVTDVVVMHDPNTQRPRGFGFISFDTEDAVDRVLIKSFHDLGGKLVEVKRALPRDSNAGGGGGRTNGEGYQGYGSSGANSGSYDSRMETNRYVQPQAAGGGYPYGSAGGYGAGGGYGYGASNNGYGGYGYPGGNAGFSGPAGPYANPSAPNAGGYVSGPPGAPGSSWAATYGANAGYGNTAPWNATGAAGSGPAVSAPTGQSPNGGAGSYGNQGYGYAGNDGSYAANPGTYGAVGGRVGNSPSNNGGGASRDQQGSGYTGNFGGGDANQGYWRTDPSQASNYGSAQQGGQMGYGSGYGGAHSRQTQPQ